MIVEDNSLIAFDLAAGFESMGYVIIGPCRNYVQALEVLSRESPDYCILDLDLSGDRRPLADITEEGRRIFWLTQSRRIRTVIHSGHRESLDRSHADARLYDVVRKPATIDEILTSIRTLGSV